MTRYNLKEAIKRETTAGRLVSNEIDQNEVAEAFELLCGLMRELENFELTEPGQVRMFIQEVIRGSSFEDADLDISHDFLGKYTKNLNMDIGQVSSQFQVWFYYTQNKWQISYMKINPLKMRFKVGSKKS